MTQDNEIELEVVPGVAEPRAATTVCCSFCGRRADEVTCVLTTRGAAICDACIARYKTQLAAECADGEQQR